MKMKNILAVLALVMLALGAGGYNFYQNQVTRVELRSSLAKGAVPKCYEQKRNGEYTLASCESLGFSWD
jgi:uncharacterized protein HemX